MMREIYTRTYVLGGESEEDVTERRRIVKRRLASTRERSCTEHLSCDGPRC